MKGFLLILEVFAFCGSNAMNSTEPQNSRNQKKLSAILYTSPKIQELRVVQVADLCKNIYKIRFDNQVGSQIRVKTKRIKANASKEEVKQSISEAYNINFDDVVATTCSIYLDDFYEMFPSITSKTKGFLTNLKDKILDISFFDS